MTHVLDNAGKVKGVSPPSIGAYVVDSTGEVKHSHTHAGTGGGGNHNLIYNYPSIELADGAQPEWMYGANCTVTEEDATGEACDSTKHERVIKGVTTAANGSVRFATSGAMMAYTVEPSLTVGVTVAFGAWVWVVTAGTVTLSVFDDVGGNIDTDTTTTTGSWVWLEATGTLTAASTKVLFQIKHNTNAATFFVAKPMANVGSSVSDFRPRKLVFREKRSASIVAINPSGTGWTTYDATGSTSLLAFAIDVGANLIGDGTLAYIMLRRTGSGAAQDGTTIVAMGDTNAAWDHSNQNIQMMNDLQKFDWSVNTSTITQIYVHQHGFWEWET
jgi:hypothetical protein